MFRQARQYYEFGAFRIDAVERLLLRDREIVPLTPKVFDTLLVLVENSGHILSKDEVMSQVWVDTVVEEANLTRNISVLRKALGESPDHYQYIETIPWRGYRFIASVREVGDENIDLIVEERTRSHVLIEQQQTSALAVEDWLESDGIQEASVPVGEIKWIEMESEPASPGPLRSPLYSDHHSCSLVNYEQEPGSRANDYSFNCSAAA